MSAHEEKSGKKMNTIKNNTHAKSNPPKSVGSISKGLDPFNFGFPSSSSMSPSFSFQYLHCKSFALSSLSGVPDSDSAKSLRRDNIVPSIVFDISPRQLGQFR